METRSGQRQIHRLEFSGEWPPGHVACYFISGAEPILVDTAMPREDGQLAEAISELGSELSDVEHILLTHPHVDHIGGVPEVLGRSDPTVYAPASVYERLTQDPDALAERVRANSRAAGFSEERAEVAVEWVVKSLERNATLLPPDAVDVWIDPEKTTVVGDLCVEPIHLPGHQADHLSYRTELGDERVLLAGDMGLEPLRPVAVHDGLDDGYRVAFDAFYAALDRMESIDIDRVYPGHGPIHDDLATTIERDRSSLDRRLDSVVDLVSEGTNTAVSIADTVTGDHDTKYLIPEMMSALAHLEADDRLVSDSIDGTTYYHA